jgi:hypothetical protein
MAGAHQIARRSPYLRRLNEHAAHEIERGLCGPSPDLLSITPQSEQHRTSRRGQMSRDPHRANRLLLRSTAWTGDSRNADADART